MSISRKLIILQMIIKNWFVRLGGAVFFIFLARQLEMDALGLVSLYVLIFNAGELLVENGVSDALASNRIKTERFCINVAAAIATGVSAIAATSWWLSSYLQTSLPGYAVVIFVVYCYLSAYSFAMQGVLRRESRFGVLAKRSAYAVTAAFVIAVGYFIYNPGADAMLCYFGVSVLTSVGLLLGEHRKLAQQSKLNADGAHHEENPGYALKQVGRFFSFKLSSFISGRSLELFVFIKFGPVGLAALVVGSRIYNVFGYFIKSVLHDYIFDINNDRHGTTDADRHAATQQTVLVATMIAAPVFLGCAAVAEPLLTLLVGADKAAAADGFLQIFCVLGLVEVIQFILFARILSSTDSLIPVLFQLVRASLLLGVFTFAGTLALAEYVTLSVMLSGAVPVLFILFSLVRRRALSRDNLVAFAMYLLAAGLMYAVVTGAERYLSELNIITGLSAGYLIALVAGMVLGVFVYPLANLILNRRDFVARLRVLLNRKPRPI
ncbi:MAG: oligosaccharide flippase family protein [Thalassolituus sp.]